MLLIIIEVFKVSVLYKLEIKKRSLPAWGFIILLLMMLSGAGLGVIYEKVFKEGPDLSGYAFILQSENEDKKVLVDFTHKSPTLYLFEQGKLTRSLRPGAMGSSKTLVHVNAHVFNKRITYTLWEEGVNPRPWVNYSEDFNHLRYHKNIIDLAYAFASH